MNRKKIAKELMKIAGELNGIDLETFKEKLADYIVDEIKTNDAYSLTDFGYSWDDDELVEVLDMGLPRKWTIQYRDRDLCVLYNIKGRGIPDIEVDGEEFQFTINEVFMPELEKKIENFTVKGRYGGYWGFEIDDISDYVDLSYDELKNSILRMNDKKIKRLIDKVDGDNYDDYVEEIWEDYSDDVLEEFDKIGTDKFVISNKFLKKVNKAEKEIERILKRSENNQFWLNNESL